MNVKLVEEKTKDAVEFGNATTNVYRQLIERKTKLAVVGLGYVGLPIALALSKKVDVIGFDLDEGKIARYRGGIDVTGEMGDEAIRQSAVDFTANEDRLNEAKVFIVTVPTPIHEGHIPDLSLVKRASRTIGKRLSKDAVVIYESTVYPGTTEEICIPLLEAESGLKCGEDFKVGYSPERINPGDKVHRLDNIVKIVAGIDEETVEIISSIYELIIHAGVYRAESIKVAEAAKVIENAQRDINIAFMNEVSMLLHQMGISTKAVLAAAQTKWNFLKFTPGLVGGHCIGVDPYYLTYKAETVGFYSKLMTTARQINENMGKYVAGQIIKMLVQAQTDFKNVKIGVLGVTYKENCRDIRNSKVIDIIRELTEYGIVPQVADPLADPRLVYEEYGIELVPLSEIRNVDMIVLAVPHQHFVELDMSRLFGPGQPKYFIDVKGVFPPSDYERSGFVYWSL